MEYRYAAGIRSPRRVAAGNDLSGLVVEYDIRYNEETCWFETPFGFFTVKEPDPASEEEVRAASELFGKAFACLFEGGGPDAHGKMASDYFDIESLARCGWLYVLSEDADYLNVGSTYFYVASDGLMHAGPAWDFDLAWANHPDVTFTIKGWVKTYGVDPEHDQLVSLERAKSVKEFFVKNGIPEDHIKTSGMTTTDIKRAATAAFDTKKVDEEFVSIQLIITAVGAKENP
jgi:hypothetical protein